MEVHPLHLLVRRNAVIISYFNSGPGILQQPNEDPIAIDSTHKSTQLGSISLLPTTRHIEVVS
jgi:hypothetical protein